VFTLPKYEQDKLLGQMSRLQDKKNGKCIYAGEICKKE
jgi:hypothetical protein